MQFDNEMPGVPLQDLWYDVPPVAGSEDLGYPTQKPEALLERVIESSSDTGDVVASFSRGGGVPGGVAQLLSGADVAPIRARGLSGDWQHEIRDVIARHQGELREMGNPTTTLEELFLSIVRDSEARPGRRAKVKSSEAAAD